MSVYISYKCNCCKKEFVLLTEDIEKIKGYLVCPYCSSRKVKKENVADNLRECMQHSSYKRIHGALRQK